MADSWIDLDVGVNADASGFVEGMTEAKGSFEKLAETIASGMGIGAGVELFGKLKESIQEAIATLPEMVSHLAELGEHIQNMSEQTGVAVEALQQLQFAAGAVGVSSDTAAMAMGRFQRNLETGNASAARAIQALGLSEEGLKAMDPTHQMETLFTALNNVENASERNAAGMMLFGRSFLQLVPMIAHFDDLKDAAISLGVVLDQSVIRAEADLATESHELGMVFDGLKNNFIAVVATSEPVHVFMQGLITLMGQLSVWVRQNTAELRSFVDAGVAIAAGALAGLVTGVGIAIQMFNNIRTSIAYVQEGLTQVAIAANAAVSAIGANKLSDLKRVWDDYKQASHDAANQSKADIAAIAASNDHMQETVQKVQSAFSGLADRVANASGVMHTATAATEGTTHALGDLSGAAEKAAKAWAAIDMKTAIEMHKEATKIMADAEKQASKYAQTILKDLVAANKAHDESIKLVDAAEKDYQAEVAKSSGDLDQQVAAIRMAAQAKNDLLEIYIAEHPHMEQADIDQLKYAEGLNLITADMKIQALEAQHLAQQLSQIGQAAQGFADMFASIAKDPSFGNIAKNIVSSISFAGVPVGQMAVGLFDTISGLFTTPEWSKAMTDVGTNWGTQIDEALAKKIADTETKDKISRFLAELLNLGDIMQQGIGQGKDAGSYWTNINDLMQAVADKAVNAKDGIDQLNKAFGDLWQGVQDGSMQSLQTMLLMIERAKQLGETIPDMTKMITQQLGDATAGLDEFFKNVGVGPTGAQSVVSLGQGAANAQLLGALFGAITAQNGAIDAAAQLKQAFADMLKTMPKGVPLTGEAAIAAQMLTLLQNKQFAAAATGAAGLGKTAKGLIDTGNMTQAMVSALGQSTQTLYMQALDAKGATQITALQAVLPALTQLQVAQELGAKMSDSDLKLLKQAQDAHLLPLQDIGIAQLDALHGIRRAIEDLHFGGGGGGGDGTGTGSGSGSSGGGGNNYSTAGPPGSRYRGSAAGGALVSSAGLYQVGEGGETEVIAPVRAILQEIGSALSGGGGNSVYHINVSGVTDPAMVAKIVVDAIEKNKHGVQEAVRSVPRRF